MISPLAMRGPSSPASGDHIWDKNSKIRAARKPFFSHTAHYGQVKIGPEPEQRSIWMAWNVECRYRCTHSVQSVLGPNLRPVIGQKEPEGRGLYGRESEASTKPSESCHMGLLGLDKPMSLHL